MGYAASENSLLRFGVFELDRETGELRKSGRLIHLRPQPSKILALLASRAGKLVTREELREQIWGREEFVDFEHALNVCIRQIRTALDDDADTPRYVETLPRRGYRFIAPVEAVAPVPDLLQPPRGQGSALPALSPERLAVSTPKRRRWLIRGGRVALLAMVLAGLTYAAWRRFLPATNPPVGRIGLAVLPFENLSGDPEQEYFADGVTEDIIADLAQISALRVVSRTSVMQYKQAKKPLPQIARELNVDVVVEGVIERSGDRLKITAELINAPADRHLWAQSYERQLRDVFVLQDEVARNIAEEVAVKLTPREIRRLTSARAIDPAAYEAYLKGRYYANQRTEAALGKSIECFEQAIEKDPTHAQGYVGLADGYLYQAVWGYLPPNQAGPKAKAAALRAVEIDDALAEAHATLGNVLLRIEWNWPLAEREFRRALELNPSLAAAHQNLGIELGARGDPVKGIAEIKRAHELDPLSLVKHYVLANMFYQARQYDQAIQELRSALEMDRSAFFLHWSLGLNYVQQGMFDEAIKEAQAAVANARGNPFPGTLLAQVYAVAGKRAQAQEILEHLKRESAHRYIPAREVAIVYANLGETDQAFQWLEKAYREHDRGLIWLKTDPALDSLRSDPRYQDLLRRMNFSQ